MNVGNVVKFVYNGIVRIVEIQKKTDTYIQGRNLHPGAEIPFATYNIKRMHLVQ